MKNNKKTLKLMTAALVLSTIALPTAKSAFAATSTSQSGLVGFATVGGTTTGGEGGKVVTVSNATDFLKYISSPDTLIIKVSGKIDLPTGMHQVSSNKTIIGVGNNAEITTGGLNFKNVHNDIVQNISFSKASDDSVNIEQGSNHIWIDHNNFSNGYDGLVDIKRQASYVTVSWNHFYDHHKTALIGHSDSNTADRGYLRVTYHHNFFDGTNSRHPRVRFGEVHVFNNYYAGVTDYGIGVGVEAKVISENNYFENKNPVKYWDKPSMKGYIKDSGSFFAGGVTAKFAPEGIKWDPKSFYSYTLDKATDVKSIVVNGAGVGKLDGSTPSVPSNPVEDKPEPTVPTVPSTPVEDKPEPTVPTTPSNPSDSQNDELENRVTNLEKQLADQKSKGDANTASIKKLESEIADLKEQQSKANVSVENTKTDKAIDKKVTDLQKKVDDQGKKLSTFEKLLKELSDLVAKIQEMLKDLLK